jgi:hypothetical protein
MKEEMIQGNFKEDWQRFMRPTHAVQPLSIGLESYGIKRVG